MNGINIISDRIMSEAKEKAAQITAEADSTAAVESAKQRSVDIEEKARLSAELERKKMLSNVKQEMIKQAFDVALKRLVSLPQDKYRALLLSLIEKAVADGKGGELLLNKNDLASHGEALAGELNSRGVKGVTLAKDTVDISGGVIIRRGSIELNSALDVIVRMLSQEAALEVSNALFS